MCSVCRFWRESLQISPQPHGHRHPSRARIGGGFFIDHGTGVVIGETAVIGERVRLYQNVTLGASGSPPGKTDPSEKGLPRHPCVQDDVVIYAGATVLGRVTIGKGAVIGGNVWVTHDVPAGGSVTQARGSEGKALADNAGLPCD